MLAKSSSFKTRCKRDAPQDEDLEPGFTSSFETRRKRDAPQDEDLELGFTSS